MEKAKKLGCDIVFNITFNFACFGNVVYVFGKFRKNLKAKPPNSTFGGFPRNYEETALYLIRLKMRFLEYLFFKYYQLQLKVGNDKNTTSAAITSLAAIFMLYFFTAFWYVCLFSDINIGGDYIPILYLALTIFVLIALILLFGIKGKDKIVIHEHEKEWKGKKNLGVIVFTMIPFVVLSLEMIFIFSS